jgi:hypothetical protein
MHRVTRFCEWKCSNTRNDKAPSVSIARSCVLEFCSINNSLISGLIQQILILCVLLGTDMCFQIITTFVCYRRESFLFNTFLFIFLCSGFEPRKCFWSSLLNLRFVFGILLVKNIKMYTYPLTIGKCNTNLSKTTEPHLYEYLQNKTWNIRAQTQRLIGFYLSARKCNYWLNILSENGSKYLRVQNKFVGIIVARRSQLRRAGP